MGFLNPTHFLVYCVYHINISRQDWLTSNVVCFLVDAQFPLVYFF